LNKLKSKLFLSSFSRFITGIRLFFWRWVSGKRPKQIDAITYRGYASRDKFFIQGRISRYKLIKNNPEASPLEQLSDTLKRIFNTRIPQVTCEISLFQHTFFAVSNSAGYFTLEMDWPAADFPENSCWIKVDIRIIPPREYFLENEVIEGEILFISGNQKFIVISDIDDTLLLTGVRSLFYWKVLYNTFLKNLEQRRGIPGAPAFFQRLSQLKDAKEWQTFVFYVSSTPRTLYDFVLIWLAQNHFPKGPILLKDFGLSTLDKGSLRFSSKIAWIRQIMVLFPDIPFVLVGDSGEKDFFLYQKLAREFPDRVKAILIREIPSFWRKNKLIHAINAFGREVPICLFKNYKEARIWVRKNIPELVDVQKDDSAESIR
jgi:phosphatidate phosphatase APP1